MPRSKASNEAQYRYNKEHLKRIPLDVQLSDYELIKAAAEEAAKKNADAIKAAADASGETVNGYIKTAIRLRMERDGFQASGPTLGGPGEAGAGLSESSE